MKYFCIMKSNIITLFFLITGIITGQNTGSLNGRIVDAQNQFPLEGATVVVLGTSIGVVSGEGGYFTIEDIPTQTYNIEVSYLGYETQTLFNTIVKSVGNIPLFFELEEIAEAKMADLNATDMDQAVKIIEGSARSMGIEVI